MFALELLSRYRMVPPYGRPGAEGLLAWLGKVAGRNLRSSDPSPLRQYRINEDRKSTRLNSSHLVISYAVFCLKKKKRQSQLVHGELSQPGCISTCVRALHVLPSLALFTHEYLRAFVFVALPPAIFLVVSVWVA